MRSSADSCLIFSKGAIVEQVFPVEDLHHNQLSFFSRKLHARLRVEVGDVRSVVRGVGAFSPSDFQDWLKEKIDAPSRAVTAMC